MTIPAFPSALTPYCVNSAFPLSRSTEWKTLLQESISGARTAFPLWSYPRRHWSIDYSLLREGDGMVEQSTLEGFIDSVNGSAQIFSYIDSTDNAVVSQGLGAGDGATSNFQLVRTYGNFVSPVFFVPTSPDIYLNGVRIKGSGYVRPTPPILSSQAGGALSSTTYYVKVTYVSPSGETLSSLESNLVVAANRRLVVSSPVDRGEAAIIGWNVYVTNDARGGSNTEMRQNGSTAIALGVNWTEPVSGLISGAVWPNIDTTGWNVSAYGVIEFAGIPLTSVTSITWTGSFGWYCRFDDDVHEFLNEYSGRWSIKKLAFSSEKF